MGECWSHSKLLLAIYKLHQFQGSILKRLNNRQMISKINYAETDSTLIPQVRPNTIIVMDNASYHIVHEDPLPTKGWLKNVIRAWLTLHDIFWEEVHVKKDLITLCEPFRSRCNLYKVDSMAEKAGHTVLRLPPYHCEFNPIENIWAYIKNDVAKQNATYRLSNVKQLTFEAIEKVTPDLWQACIGHAIQEEDVMWKLDGMMVDLVPIAFTVNTLESSEDESEDEIHGNQAGIEIAGTRGLSEI